MVTEIPVETQEGPFLLSAASKVEGYVAVVHTCYIVELSVNASAQPLGAPRLPLIVCDL